MLKQELYDVKVLIERKYFGGSRKSIAFFKMVQNKLHFATHGNTAAEVIYNRAD
jgi:hypothetical protein